MRLYTMILLGVIMVTNEPNTKKEPVKSLLPRIHVNEFLKLYTNLTDEMHQAGFKAYAKKEWMRKEEWDEVLKSYLNR